MGTFILTSLSTAKTKWSTNKYFFDIIYFAILFHFHLESIYVLS